MSKTPKNFARTNKFASFKYNVDKRYEAGIVLSGKDVKAIRANEFEIRDAFIKIEGNEIFVWNIIFPGQPQSINKRKLLLHKSEIEKIKFILKEKRVHGFVLGVKYNDKNLIKFDIGFGTTKKVEDKKASDKRASEKIRLQKEIKNEYY